MKEKDLVRFVDKIGGQVVFSKHLGLWQIILGNESFYLSPQDAETFSKKELDAFIASNLMRLIESGGYSEHISLN